MKTSPAKRVLVTGVTGFIGRHVADSLQARGFEVHLLVRDRRSNRAPAAGVVLHEADLFDEQATARVVKDAAPTHLLHLAWVTTHGKFWTAEENHDWLAASLNLARHFADSGGRRIVSAGTCAEYDWSAGHCSEHSTPLRPGTLYGDCKNQLREAIDRLAAPRGISTAWGRLFFLYGPGEDRARLVPSLMLALLRGECAECHCGDHVRDFLHAADAADAFAALLDSDVRGPVNLASGESIRLAELAQAIATIAGHPGRLRTGNRPATADNPRVLSADTTRLRDEVGWHPRIDLTSGLRALYEELGRDQAHPTAAPTSRFGAAPRGTHVATLTQRPAQRAPGHADW